MSAFDPSCLGPATAIERDGTAIGEATFYEGTEAAAALLDTDGSTLIVHESEDDHVTQPIGGAGGRVACGVVEAR